MALTELTKVTGPGIHTLSNVLSHNIKSSGIITATKFSGPLDSIGGNFAGVITATNGVFSGNISAVDGNFSGNVSVGGTLTYEDVTNIDSVGIVTARDGLKVLAGGANVVGVVTATTFKGDGDFVDIDVDGHTNLDNVNVAGVATFASAVNTGALTATTGTFSGNVSIGGTLTYEDVTNIDSVGIITARDGLKVLAGGVNVVGVVTATSFVGGLPITSGADNRVITASSASAIQGEANLYFNGTSLSVGGSNVTDVNLLTLNGTGASTNIGL